MKKLFKDKKGFTLMEMLIVVAIIVILVAVSIPVFTSQLENARKATDEANIRAAKAEIIAQYLSKEDFTVGTYYYDAVNGKLKEHNTDVAETYGKSSATVTGASEIPKDKILEVSITGEGEVTLKWVPNTATPGTP